MMPVPHCFYGQPGTISKKLVFRFRHHNVGQGCHSSEKFREKWILQDLRKAWEFYFETGKIYVFERSQGKVKVKVNM